MDLREARLEGRAPPEGWQPPARPRALDAVRTFLVSGAVAPVVAARMTLALAKPRPDDPASSIDRVRAGARRVLSWLGVELDVGGSGHVPRDGGLVFMWNQESHLDHLVLMAALPRPAFTLYNNAVRATPFYGQYLRRSGHVWVDRNDESQWRPAIAQAAARVQGGECALVSPEGTRSWDGQLLPMKRGAFQLASLSGRPIVCITVAGGHERLPRGAMVVRPGTIRVAFSAPLSPPPSGDAEEWKRDVVRTFEQTKKSLASSTAP